VKSKRSRNIPFKTGRANPHVPWISKLLENGSNHSDQGSHPGDSPPGREKGIQKGHFIPPPTDINGHFIPISKIGILNMSNRFFQLIDDVG
jgi:hypothetical protein